MALELTGCFTAIVTPFRNGAVDETALADLVDWQLSSGVKGIVAAGTTGEGYNLSPGEYRRVLRACVASARGKGPVIAGAGTHSTSDTIELVKEAAASGCDAALVVTPYYCKPPQRGLVLHYRAVAAASPIPVILYNVPSRTGVTLEPETAAEAARIPNVAGLKEAAGSAEAAARVIALAPAAFAVVSGDDALTLPMIAVGAKGVISVASNVAPSEISQLVAAALAGDLARARALNAKLLPLMKALFLESNPIPVKAALAWMGRISPEIRLPLVPMSSERFEPLARELTALGLLRQPAAA